MRTELVVGSACRRGVRVGQPLMQPSPNIVGGVRVALALITGNQDTTGHHSGDTGQTNPFPKTFHDQILHKLPE